MFKTRDEALAFIYAVNNDMPSIDKVDTVICAPFVVLRCLVKRQGENLRIEGADGFIVKVPEAFREKVSAYAGKEVIFGVRPEDMSLHDPANTNEDYTVSAKADVIELLGSEIFVHMTCAKVPCVARMEVPTQQLQVGQTLKIDIKMLKTHVFDKSTSLVIV